MDNTVQQGAALTLAGVALPGGVTVQDGGDVAISGGVIDGSLEVQSADIEMLYRFE